MHAAEGHGLSVDARGIHPSDHSSDAFQDQGASNVGWVHGQNTHATRVRAIAGPEQLAQEHQKAPGF